MRVFFTPCDERLSHFFFKKKIKKIYGDLLWSFFSQGVHSVLFVSAGLAARLLLNLYLLVLLNLVLTHKIKKMYY
jgi:hypothetical protein